MQLSGYVVPNSTRLTHQLVLSVPDLVLSQSELQSPQCWLSNKWRETIPWRASCASRLEDFHFSVCLPQSSERCCHLGPKTGTKELQKLGWIGQYLVPVKFST